MEKQITTIGTLAASRRQKWKYPTAQQTPRILHLPRRPRRRSTPAATKAVEANRKVKLETLFDQEREFSRGSSPVEMANEERRERVEETESGAVEEEKWRFQAEMLRAECNLLRMERGIAVKKMERRRVQLERALKSAVQILLSGRKRICEGKIAGNLLEEELMELVEELEKLQRRSKNKGFEVRNCSNFDKQASLLQTQIEKFAGEANEICVKEIQEMAEASLSITTTGNNVEILRRKMDGLSSENLLETMKMDKNKCKNRTCCGCCEAIMQRVVDQIRAETEQWSQMQEILGQVRDEMEDLQASRAFWEDRALSSGHEVESLNRVANQWRQKALASEARVEELQAKVSVLELETEKLRKERDNRAKNLVQTSHELTNETEKRVLVCRLKENRHEGRKTTNVSSSRGHCASNRTPFREIGNSSPLMRQNNNNSRAVFPLCYALSMNENKI